MSHLIWIQAVCKFSFLSALSIEDTDFYFVCNSTVHVYHYYFQGSLKIYKVPLPADIEDKTVTGGDPSLGLFQGLPGNDPIKVLVRVYVVKVSNYLEYLKKKIVILCRAPTVPCWVANSVPCYN